MREFTIIGKTNAGSRGDGLTKDAALKDDQQIMIVWPEHKEGDSHSWDIDLLDMSARDLSGSWWHLSSGEGHLLSGGEFKGRKASFLTPVDVVKPAKMRVAWKGNTDVAPAMFWVEPTGKADVPTTPVPEAPDAPDPEVPTPEPPTPPTGPKPPESGPPDLINGFLLGQNRTLVMKEEGVSTNQIFTGTIVDFDSTGVLVSLNNNAGLLFAPWDSINWIK